VNLGTLDLSSGHWLAVAFSMGLASMAFFLVAGEAKKSERPLRYVSQFGFIFGSASLGALAMCVVRFLQWLWR
jgi:hypothetical protein